MRLLHSEMRSATTSEHAGREALSFSADMFDAASLGIDTGEAETIDRNDVFPESWKRLRRQDKHLLSNILGNTGPVRRPWHLPDQQASDKDVLSTLLL
jgi:hypothetical protein